jgi:carbonic anhydrase
MRLSLSATFAVFFPLLFAASALHSSAQSAPQWDYEGRNGPQLWSKQDPAWRACNKGEQQSPIDIRGAKLNKALQPIEFHYVAGPVTLVNDGHTVRVNVDPFSYIVVDGTRYDLQSYEFHHPSEHTIKSKLSDMEVDLIHKSADGKEAILAVLFDESIGNANATLASLWPSLPKAAGRSGKVTDMVNAAGLLPADRGYWTYEGSELTPPCTEGVKWFVFENAVSISRGQYNAFANLYKQNSRPLQVPHGRKIEANE